jgi:hypothetical protein
LNSAISSVAIRLRKNGQPSHISRCSSASPAASASPAPYQDGSSSRFCVHANTHGIARSAAMSPTAPREGGREPRLSSDSSAMGEIWAKKRGNASSP